MVDNMTEITISNIRKCKVITNTKVDGTNIFEKKEYYGLFHGWGFAKNGEMQISIGIIETINGQINEVIPSDINFLPSDFMNKELDNFRYLGYNNLGRDYKW